MKLIHQVFHNVLINNINNNLSNSSYTLISTNSENENEESMIKQAVFDCWSAISHTEPVIRIVSLINTLIFIAWYILPPDYMYYHFTDSVINRKQRRWWSMIFSQFSHQNIMHLSGNLAFLTLFGSTSVETYGLLSFSILLLLSSLISSIISQFYYHFIRKQVYCLGFSGINTALLVVHSSIKPNETVKLGNNSISSQNFLTSTISADFIGLANNLKYHRKKEGFDTNINHAAHLGGYMAGYLFVFLYNYKNKMKKIKKILKYIYKMILFPINQDLYNSFVEWIESFNTYDD